MRLATVLTAIATTFIALATAACSAASEGEDACVIVGTYSSSATAVAGNCPVPDDAPPATITISAGPDNLYAVEFAGLTGGCVGEAINACKLQGKCDIAISDAINPGDRGTFQFSWTFNSQGYNGSSTLVVPPAESLPGGCSGTNTVSAQRL